MPWGNPDSFILGIDNLELLHHAHTRFLSMPNFAHALASRTAPCPDTWRTSLAPTRRGNRPSQAAGSHQESHGISSIPSVIRYAIRCGQCANGAQVTVFTCVFFIENRCCKGEWDMRQVTIERRKGTAQEATYPAS